MWKTRIIASAVFVLFVFGIESTPSAQDAPGNGAGLNAERRAAMLGFVRTINTLGVVELSDQGSYAQWPVLLAHHQKEFDAWLERFGAPGLPNVHFSEKPEILPGWNLRLNVRDDGKGYVLLLNDSRDEAGFALVSDETGIIRECKYIQ